MSASVDTVTRPAQASAALPWWAMDPQQVAARLGTDPDRGLSVEEAAQRLAAVGSNQLQAATRRPRWLLFLAQFTNTMIMVLLAAAVVTAILGDLKDTVVIVAVVVLNAIISFVQEQRAEQAITALQRMSAPEARITRAGQARPSRPTSWCPGTCCTWTPAMSCPPTRGCWRHPTCGSMRPP